MFVVEGEKDADRLAGSGILATTNVGGASKNPDKPKWLPEYSDALVGRNVVIIPDNDQPGRAHAEGVARLSNGKAASIRVLELLGISEKGDASDWLDSGHTTEELMELAESAPLWTPKHHKQNGQLVNKPKNDEQPEVRLPPTCRELYHDYKYLRPHIIDGLLREGETMNCITAPKLGKSWLAINAALCVVTGKRWLEMFATTAGNVLIVDNELHTETIAHRIPKVADALASSSTNTRTPSASNRFAGSCATSSGWGRCC